MRKVIKHLNPTEVTGAALSFCGDCISSVLKHTDLEKQLNRYLGEACRHKHERQFMAEVDARIKQFYCQAQLLGYFDAIAEKEAEQQNQQGEP